MVKTLEQSGPQKSLAEILESKERTDALVGDMIPMLEGQPVDEDFVDATHRQIRFTVSEGRNTLIILTKDPEKFRKQLEEGYLFANGRVANLSTKTTPPSGPQPLLTTRAEKMGILAFAKMTAIKKELAKIADAAARLTGSTAFGVTLGEGGAVLSIDPKDVDSLEENPVSRIRLSGTRVDVFAPEQKADK